MIELGVATEGDATTMTLAVDGDPHQICWAGGVSDAGAADAALVTALLPAMAARSPVSGPPVSPGLLRNLDTVQDVFIAWSRRKALVRNETERYARVEVAVPARVSQPTIDDGERGVAVLFSGGVDSFYTVLRRRHEIDALVFVHGLDVRLDDPLRESVVDGVRSAAAELGLVLVEVATDVRQTTDRFVPWEDSHGAALAAVAHLLSDRFHTALVPATSTYDALYPLGSHPLVDPLWGSERVRLVHDGCEADRVQKTQRIAASPVARRWLRVCPRYGGEPYNCGQCEKCLRTMVGARLAGVPDAFATLPPMRGAQRLRELSRVRIKGRGTTWDRYRLLARRTTRDRALQAALDVAWARYRFRERRVRHPRPR